MHRPLAQNASFDRMERAVERVRDRLLRATRCLEQAAIPYAVAGGNAVAAWVSTIDEAAVRNTQDVDILVRKSDAPLMRAAMERAGFVYRHAASIDMFLDSPDASPRNAVHVIYAGELVRLHEPEPNPDVAESERAAQDSFQVLSLAALVRIKLTAFRDKDRTHLRDMIGVGLIDGSWLTRLSPVLAARLKQLLDTPDG